MKAFRDTWKDGIHSYLTYLRDRLTVARDLLTESGSIFVQIGDENVHRVRAVMDEVFGAENFISQITFTKTSRRLRVNSCRRTCDYIALVSRKIKIASNIGSFISRKSVGGDGCYSIQSCRRSPTVAIRPTLEER